MAYKRKLASILEPHDSVCPGFFPDLLYSPRSQGRSIRIQDHGANISPMREGLVRLAGKWEEWLLCQSYRPYSPTPLSAWNSMPSSGSCRFHGARALQGRASRSPEDGATAFPQGDAICRKVHNPKKMVSAVWERDSAWGPCPFSSLLRATKPILSAGDSCLLCPPSAGAQGKWLQMRFCVLAL